MVALDGFYGIYADSEQAAEGTDADGGKIYVTVTLDAWEDPMKKVSMHKLSYLEQKDDTAAGRGGKRMWLYAGKAGSARKEGSIRSRSAPALRFLERHLFRPGNRIYEAQDS